MAALSSPNRLGREADIIGVPLNVSASQYAASPDAGPTNATHRQRLGLPLASSIVFCISLHLGISPEQDALYVLIYALIAEAVTLLKAPEVRSAVCIVTAVAGVGTTVSLVARSIVSFNPRDMTAKSAEERPSPMFFPVQTSHTRLFPKVHSLSYPFMWTGIPIGFRGNTNGALSVERKIEGSHPTWFTIDACDYLSRGSDEIGLDGKLRKFLISQGANPNDYPFAYLLTVAKFSGHAFNPVSFWYLYSASRSISAVILEVNNTFGERHLYFLDHSSTPSSSASTGSPRFTSAFPKDFFVSPFSDRSGSYSLVTNDPLHPNMTGTVPINLTITLSSDEGKPKVVARVYSRGKPVDPATMSWIKVQKFAMSQAWNTWATEPRTVYQAGLLTFKRGLSIFSVPEPLKSSMPRKAKDHEMVIEGVFRQYLQTLVKNAAGCLEVQYIAAGVTGSTVEVMETPAVKDASAEGVNKVAIRVLTPLFYSRIARYESLRVALREEARQGQTVEEEGLELLFQTMDKGFAMTTVKGGFLDTTKIRSMALLRRRTEPLFDPTATDREMKSSPEVAHMGKDKVARTNEMDVLASLCTDKEQARLYKMAVQKLLLSDWLALGNMDLLALERFIVRVGLIWMVGNGLREVLRGLL